MLTAQQLKDMKSGQIIAQGVTSNPRLYKDPVKWIAVRGKGFHDWALYYHLQHMSNQTVLEAGDKSTTESVIRGLVPCDDEAWNLYRM